jgi:hypothetical protein
VGPGWREENASKHESRAPSGKVCGGFPRRHAPTTAVKEENEQQQTPGGIAGNFSPRVFKQRPAANPVSKETVGSPGEKTRLIHWRMIRKSCVPVFLLQAQRACAQIMLNQKSKRDRDSASSHCASL